MSHISMNVVHILQQRFVGIETVCGYVVCINHMCFHNDVSHILWTLLTNICVGNPSLFEGKDAYRIDVG